MHICTFEKAFDAWKSFGHHFAKMILREEEAISIGLIDLIDLDYLDDLDSGMIEASQWQVSASIVQEPCFVEDIFAALHGNLMGFWFEDSWRYLWKWVNMSWKKESLKW